MEEKQVVSVQMFGCEIVRHWDGSVSLGDPKDDSVFVDFASLERLEALVAALKTAVEVTDKSDG